MISAKAWLLLLMSSSRSAVHLIDRRNLRAAMQIRSSSG
jgi:hypothetical protein